MDDVTQQLSRLYEDTPVLVAAYDGQDRLRYANRAFRAAFFIAEGENTSWAEIMRRNVAARQGTIIQNPNFEEWLLSAQSRRGKMPFRAFETDLHDGRWFWMTETVQSDGWMLCIASDITNMRPDERAVRQDRDFAIKASNTDDLTGVANRRFVTARMEDMLRREAPSDWVLGCICVLDLDNFKYINDRHGHVAGDLILRDFARRIHDQVRRTDCFGRVGGEEFVLVLPDTPVPAAALIVERMLATVRASRPLPELADFAYTFSAGIAAGAAGDTPSTLYARADRALYSAKLAGRNRIHLDERSEAQAAATAV
ncbi:GGDEF domain-containing protein [Aquabacter sp. CN5-332]|uniref:sensor domain-containing diguanylate cyclase n=1 Tax=Aquabacter sp. CN5-332 TaxID=3156608 RepID=UPI0032B55FC3